jgi:peptide/nickel transport system substrate-binding protein
MGFAHTMRFNWLQPPFDNVKMRQAVLQVVNQSDYMQKSEQTGT